MLDLSSNLQVVDSLILSGAIRFSVILAAGFYLMYKRSCYDGYTLQCFTDLTLQ